MFDCSCGKSHIKPVCPQTGKPVELPKEPPVVFVNPEHQQPRPSWMDISDAPSKEILEDRRRRKKN